MNHSLRALLALSFTATTVWLGCAHPNDGDDATSSTSALSQGADLTLSQDGNRIVVAMDANGLGATSTLFDPSGALVETHHINIAQNQPGVSNVDNGNGTYSIIVGTSKFTWTPNTLNPSQPPTSGMLTTDNGTFAVTLGAGTASPTTPGQPAPAAIKIAAVDFFGWIELGIAAADALCHYYLGRLRAQCNSIGCVFTDQGSCGPPFFNQLKTDCECPPGASGHWVWPKVKVVQRDTNVSNGART